MLAHKLHCSVLFFADQWRIPTRGRANSWPQNLTEELTNWGRWYAGSHCSQLTTVARDCRGKNNTAESNVQLMDRHTQRNNMQRVGRTTLEHDSCLWFGAGLIF